MADDDFLGSPYSSHVFGGGVPLLPQRTVMVAHPPPPPFLLSVLMVTPRREVYLFEFDDFRREGIWSPPTIILPGVYLRAWREEAAELVREEVGLIVPPAQFTFLGTFTFLARDSAKQYLGEHGYPSRMQHLFCSLVVTEDWPFTILPANAWTVGNFSKERLPKIFAYPYATSLFSEVLRS